MPEGLWLNDTQWERLAPLLPEKPRAVARVDDRRVISGVIVALAVGPALDRCSGRVCPRKTLYNRSVRWSAKGVWQQVFTTLAAADGSPAAVLVGSTHNKAQHCAAGGKGGSKPRRSAPSAADARPRSTP